jgi:hypothetical protein
MVKICFKENEMDLKTYYKCHIKYGNAAGAI